MFSSDMLSQIIRFYGNAMQGMMGNYLEKNIHTFIEIQKRGCRTSRARCTARTRCSSRTHGASS